MYRQEVYKGIRSMLSWALPGLQSTELRAKTSPSTSVPLAPCPRARWDGVPEAGVGAWRSCAWLSFVGEQTETVLLHRAASSCEAELLTVPQHRGLL